MTRRSLEALAAEVASGDTLAFGGKTLHRAPMAFARALARRGVTDLAHVGLAKSVDVDLLCATGQLSRAYFGYVGFEALGLAPNFRRAVEAGELDPREGTCYTVAAMLRGAKQGVPFLPVAGLEGSDLPEVREDSFERVTCPYTGEEVYTVRSLAPDVAVVHATEADETGNARFQGADLTEGLLARAADRVFVTAERIVPRATFEDDPGRTDVPGVLVDGVAEVPYGAHPCSCPGRYDYDADHIREYVARSREGAFDRYRETYLAGDEATYRDRAVAGREAAIAWETGGQPA